MTKTNQCGSCDASFKRGEKSISCSACKHRYHYQCSMLSESEFDVCSNKSILKWFCRLCENDVNDILTNFEKFKKVSKEIMDMKSELDSRFNKVEDRIAVLEARKGGENVEDLVRETISKDVSLNPDEQKLIDAKRCNLIYFNLPESDIEDIGEKMKHDYRKLRSLYRDNFATPENIDSCYRVGKKNEDKTRPLVVKFKSADTRNKILSNSRDLFLTENRNRTPVFVSIDRTPKQRAEHKKLVTELKSRKENGDENIGIRNGRIIENFQKSTTSTRIRWADLFTQ